MKVDAKAQQSTSCEIRNNFNFLNIERKRFYFLKEKRSNREKRFKSNILLEVFVTIM